MALNIDLDQFYTADYEVDKCMKAVSESGINLKDYDMILEPSAGTGAFYSQFPEDTRVGLDLEPKMEGIIKTDFFHFSPYTIHDTSKKKIITIGNPPYGRAGNLAVKFVNECGKWSEYVCMVLPRSFKKDSIQNRVNLDLHLIHQHDVNDFILPDSTVRKVNSVFQIWEKREYKRSKVVKRKTTELWDWVKPEEADCATIFFGTPTGRLKTENLTELTTTTHAFMKSKIPLNELINLFEKSSEEIKSTCRGSNTAAGSLSKGDVIEIVERTFSKSAL